MNQRVWWLFWVIFVLLIAGLAMKQGWLLIFALPFIIYLGAALWLNPEAPTLQASRTLSSDCVLPGAEVQVILKVTNRGHHLAYLHLVDQLPDHLELVGGDISQAGPLQAGESLELDYRLRGSRGSYWFDACLIQYGDSLGLVEHSIQLGVRARLLILPEVLRLQRLAVHPQRTHGFAGPYPSRQGGAGVDFFCLREYQPGDRLRWVNWRLSARQEELLFTNLFEQQRIAHIGIILDARQQCYAEIVRKDLFEHAVSAAAAISESLLKDGNRVGLLIYGWGLDRTFPGYGKVQRERILRSLAKAEMGVNYALEQLDSLPTRFFPPRSMIILISPLSRTDDQFLIRLRSWGYQILVLSPNPIKAEARVLPDIDQARYACRLALIERTLILRRLQAVGVQVVDWDTADPLDGILRAELARQPLQPTPLMRLTR